MARRNNGKKKCERAREVEVAQHLTLAKGASPSPLYVKWNDTVLICASMDQLGCKCGQLTGVRALSDCDTVSYPYGKENKSTLKVLMNNDVWSRK